MNEVGLRCGLKKIEMIIGIPSPRSFPARIRNTDLLQSAALIDLPAFASRRVQCVHLGPFTGTLSNLIPLTLQRCATRLGCGPITRLMERHVDGVAPLVPGSLPSCDVIIGHGLMPLEAPWFRPPATPVLLGPGYMPSDYGPEEADRATKSDLFRIRTRKASGIFLTNGESVRLWNDEVGAPGPDRVFEVPCFSPGLPRSSVVRSRPQTERRHIRLAFVGRMAKRKGLDTLIEAIGLLPSVLRQRVELTVVSDLRDGAVDLSAPYIHHMSSATNEEVVELFRNSDALCLPTRRESFGIVFIEAMASGCAVLGPNRSVQRAMLGNAAVLVEPENVLDVRDGLERIAEFRLRKEAVERGYALYRLKYAPDRVADAFVAAAETMLDNGRNTPVCSGAA